MKNFTTEDILSCLDKATGNLDFPGFDNMNYDMVTARLTGFKNENDWALTIEQIFSWYSLNGVEPVLMISAFGCNLLINDHTKKIMLIGENGLLSKKRFKPTET
ncbi:MAG: hypothetical protein AAGM40_31025 [Cyanobacteria bacterium J06573_2]